MNRFNVLPAYTAPDADLLTLSPSPLLSSCLSNRHNNLPIQLTISLGIPLNHTEIETALYVLDKDGSGTISEKEFVEWWRGSSASLSLAYGMA